MASDLSGAPPAGSPADAPSWSSEDTTPREIAGALARLSEHRDGGRGRAYAPARALSLVTVADRGRSDELVSRLDRLGGLAPSRTIVCVVDERRSGLGASATMDFQTPAHSGALAVFRERVEIHLAPDLLGQIDSILDRLLIADVPTILWSPSHPEAVESMLADARVVLVDTGDAADPGAALVRVADVAERVAVVDLAWHRTTPWRERLAAAFQRAGERGALERIEGVCVRHQPEAVASGLLLTGWLCSRLGWHRAQRLAQRPGGGLGGAAESAAGTVELALEPVPEQTVPGLAGVTVTGAELSLTLDRGVGGLCARQRMGPGRELSWTALGASRGEDGILRDALRDALVHDPAYRPSLHAAAGMLG